MSDPSDIFVSMRWDATSEEYPSVRNPQALLTLPPGQHSVSVVVTRPDQARDDPLGTRVFKVDSDDYLYLTPEDTDLVAKSPYKRHYESRVVSQCEGGPNNYYIIVPALGASAVDGPVKINVKTGGAVPTLTALSASVGSAGSSWTAGSNGGYGRPDNPQFKVQVPAGRHRVCFKAQRTDAAHDQGFIMWLFASDTGVARVDKDAAVAATKFLSADDVSIVYDVEADAPRSYIAVCCLQHAGASGPLKLLAASSSCTPVVTMVAGGAAISRPTQVSQEEHYEEQQEEAAPAEAAAPVAASASVASNWREGDPNRAGGYGSSENPQFLLRCANGADKLILTLDRTDGAKDEGIVLFAYPYVGKGGYQQELPEEEVGQSKFMCTDRVELVLSKVAFGSRLLLVPCLQNEGTTGPFSVSVAGCDSATVEELMEPEVTLGVVAGGSWKGCTAAGYQEVANPQFLLRLPAGKHKVKFSVSRPGGAADVGLVMFAYEYRGVGGRMTDLEDGSMGKGAVLVGQTEYMTADKVEGEATLVGGPNYYMLLPCLQAEGLEGPFSVIAEVDNGETAVQLFELTSQASASLELVAETAWTAELSGGYQKFINPQVGLELPQGKHSVQVVVSRPGGEADQGLAGFIYKVDIEGRASTGKMVSKSKFCKAASQTMETTLEGFPARHVVIPCLQTKGTEGPVVVTVSCSTAIPILTVYGAVGNQGASHQAFASNATEASGVACKVCGNDAQQLFFRDDAPDQIMCGRCWLLQGN